MNELILHIEYLMLRYDWVVVPGLGSFVREHKPAFYDTHSRVWFPAREQISFVSGRFPEDNLLLISYCRKYGISLRVASELLRNDIEELKDAIRKQENVEFANFGTFFLSTSGNIVFRSVLTHEETNIMQGYFPVAMDELENMDAARIEDIEKDIYSEAEEKGTQAFNFEKNYYFRVRKSFVRTAACFLLLILASLSFVVPTAVEPEFRAIDGLANVINDNYQIVTVPEITNDSVRTEELAQQATDEEKEAKYHLIVGTFRSVSEAEQYIKTLSVSADELRCLPTKTLVRVACASSDNIEELQSRLNSESFKAEYKEAWIWSNNK